MEGRDPWLKWYPDEVLGHTGLRLCSLAARGLWQDCRAIMHRDGQPYGHLALKEGVPMSEKQLCARLNTLPKIVRSSFRELLEVNHVFQKLPSGVVLCPLLLEQARKRELGRVYGGRGGNPAVLGLSRGLTPPVNPTVKGEDGGGLTQPLTPSLNPSLARARLSLSSLDSGSLEGGGGGEKVGGCESGKVSGAHAARAPLGGPPEGAGALPPTANTEGIGRPTLQEVMTLGAMQYAMSEEECRSFWEYYESVGWMQGRTPIVNFRHSLSRWKTRSAEMKKTATHAVGAPFKNAAAVEAEAAEVAAIRAELEWQQDPSRRAELRAKLKKRGSNV